MEKISDYITKFLKRFENKDFRRLIRVGLYIWILLVLIITLATDVNVKESKEYYEWDHVALYILEYNDLPDNYVPKAQGVADDEYHITVFAVYDNTREPIKLPTGYTYTEAYINANKDNIQGNSLERFVFSDEQLYYTDDHYLSFEEVNRADILGTHYFFLVLTIVSFVLPPVLTVVLIRKDYLAVTIVKTDLLSDWVDVKSFITNQISRFKQSKDAIE